MAKKIGTCPACFGTFSLDAKGLVVRHGWNEIGQRILGSYGNATHSGACFGTGYQPFEISTAGTVAYAFRAVIPAGEHALAHVAHLATRPAIVVEGSTGETHYEHGSRAYGVRGMSAAYAVRLVDGETVTIPGRWKPSTFVFEVEHEKRTVEAAEHVEGIRGLLARLFDAVSNWTPAEVRSKPVKATPALVLHKPGARYFGACGGAYESGIYRRKVYGRAAVAGETVTCAACLALG